MSRPRSYVPALAALALAAGCGGATAQHPAAHRSARTAHRGAAQPAHAAPVRLRIAARGRLAAPVEDPATAPAAGGAVILAGGLDSRDVSVDTISEVRGTAAATLGRLPGALHDAAAARIGAATYFFGGGNLGSSGAIVRLGANPVPVGRLPVAASDVSAATVGGTAYVVGGYTGTAPLRTIVAWRPGRSARVVAELPVPLRYAAVAALGSRIVIAGGTSGVTAQRAVYAFDPASATLRRIATLPRPLTHAAAAALAGRVFLIGGRGAALDSQTDAILAIDPAKGAVRRAGRLPVALSDTGAATSGGRVVVAGGRDRTGAVHDELLALAPR